MPGAPTAIEDWPACQSAIAMVVAYADALDARDWGRYRALFEDELEIDYGAIGSFVGTMSADDWTARCQALQGFDATAHRIGNPVAQRTGDAAIVTSIVDAAHFVTAREGVLFCDLIGRYTHRLIRRAGVWRIAAVTLGVVGYPAGRAAFDAAFAAARARFAENER